MPSSPFQVMFESKGKRFHFPLSKEDRKRIVKSWEAVPDPQEFGQNLFIAIFREEPELKKAFGCEQFSLEKLKTCSLLKRHAANFVNYISVVVRSLEGGEGAEELALKRIHTLGARHHQLAPGFGIDGQHWGVVLNCLVEQIKIHSVAEHKRRQSLATRFSASRSSRNDPWRNLMAFVISEMNKSYYDAEPSEPKTSAVCPEPVDRQSGTPLPALASPPPHSPHPPRPQSSCDF